MVIYKLTRCFNYIFITFFSHSLFVLRAAARQCGIWEKPPLLRDINGQVLDGYIKKVILTFQQNKLTTYSTTQCTFEMR